MLIDTSSILGRGEANAVVFGLRLFMMPFHMFEVLIYIGLLILNFSWFLE